MENTLGSIMFLGKNLIFWMKFWMGKCALVLFAIMCLYDAYMTHCGYYTMH